MVWCNDNYLHFMIEVIGTQMNGNNINEYEQQWNELIKLVINV